MDDVWTIRVSVTPDGAWEISVDDPEGDTQASYDGTNLYALLGDIAEPIERDAEERGLR